MDNSVRPWISYVGAGFMGKETKARIQQEYMERLPWGIADL